MKEIALEDIVERWCALHCPALASDEFVSHLILFIHSLLLRVAQEERRATLLRVLRVCPS
jgi:hypothetical protein